MFASGSDMNRRQVFTLFAAAIAALSLPPPASPYRTLLRHAGGGKWVDVEFDELQEGDCFVAADMPGKIWRVTGSPKPCSPPGNMSVAVALDTTPFLKSPAA